MRNRIQVAINRAFSKLGDVPKEVVYHEAGETVFDPGSGNPPTTESTPHSVQALFRRFRRREIDNVHILPSDSKLILNPCEVSWECKRTDWVIDGDQRWEVKELLTDGRVIPILQVREVAP